MYPKCSHSFCANPTGSFGGNCGFDNFDCPKFFPVALPLGAAEGQIYPYQPAKVIHAIETIGRMVIIRHRSVRVC